MQDEFPELLQVLFWLRMAIAAAVGLACAVSGITGAAGFVM
jgi:hypothetical protein